MYKNEEGKLIGISDWRSQPIDERRANKLYEFLKSSGYLPVLKYIGMEAVARWDGLNDVPGNPQWQRSLVHPDKYVDASKWIRDWE